MFEKAPRFYIHDQNGTPQETDADGWINWLKEHDRQVKFDRITEKIAVSTVFLGIDHNHFDRGPPILWETMIAGGPENGYRQRYSSLDEARRGHDEAVTLARKHLLH